MTKKVINIAVFASGQGSNFSAIHQYFKTIEVANLKLLVSNKSVCGAMNYAKENAIDNIHISSLQFNNFDEYSIALKKILIAYNIDLVVLAGYLKKIPEEIINYYKNRIINIHPALLPKYGGEGMYGINVHEAVIKANEPESGFTVHHVTQNYDEGEVIATKRVEISANETPESLQKKVFSLENKYYPQIIYDFSQELINSKKLLNSVK